MKDPHVMHVSLEEALLHLAIENSKPLPSEGLKLGLIVGDHINSVLAARILSQAHNPSHLYLSKSFHAFVEMDPWASAFKDSSELIQYKAAKFLRSEREVCVQPLANQGIRTAVFLSSEPATDAWSEVAITKLLCQGLDQALFVQGLEQSLDAEMDNPPIQAGPQALARATHAYRSKSPNMLKALVFLTPEAWLGQKPEVSNKLGSWLDEQQSTAGRLKLGLDISRMCFTASDKLQQRQLNHSVSSLLTCNWADLLGYMAYADLIVTDQKELIRVAKYLGKSHCNLL